MKNKLTIISVLLVAVVLLFGCTGQQQTQTPTPQNVQPNVPTMGNSTPVAPTAPSMQNGTANASSGTHPAPPSLVGTNFSQWRYYPMAFQIAPGNISASAQTALNIFTVNQTQEANGTILVMVTDNVEKVTNTFTVNQGEILYFSDGTPADDVGNESDSTLIDDHFVLVDSNNTIVQMLDTP